MKVLTVAVLLILSLLLCMWKKEYKSKHAQANSETVGSIKDVVKDMTKDEI